MYRKTLLEIFLDFTFLLCISPFRIQTKHGDYIPGIFTWKPQKVFTAFFAVLDIFGAVTRIRLNLEKKLDNPVGYFNFLWSIASTLMHISFFHVLWTKQHHILSSVQIYKRAFSKKHFKSKFPWNGVFGICACCVSLFMGLLPTLKGSYLLPHPNLSSYWSPINIFQAHIRHSKFMFFLSNSSIPDFNFNASYSLTDELQIVEVVEGVGHILVYTSRYFGAYFIDLFMIFSALTIWLGVNSFIREATHEVLRPDLGRGDTIACIEENGTYGVLNLNSVVEKYGDLKSLANSINAAMSPILFCYVFEAIFYYATNLNSVFTANDWHSRLQVVHFLLGASAVFGFSADVTKKMAVFRLWLVSEAVGKSFGRDDRLTVLIQETQSKAIGVSAYGIFTIDYPLIFNIVTTTVTFFLIVVQFVPNTCGD